MMRIARQKDLSNYECQIMTYVGALADMAQLAAPIDLFFTAVMVMVEDAAVRNNRLALLKALTNLAVQTADFSKIVTA